MTICVAVPCPEGIALGADQAMTRPQQYALNPSKVVAFKGCAAAFAGDSFIGTRLVHEVLAGLEGGETPVDRAAAELAEVLGAEVSLDDGAKVAALVAGYRGGEAAVFRLDVGRRTSVRELQLEPVWIGDTWLMDGLASQFSLGLGCEDLQQATLLAARVIYATVDVQLLAHTELSTGRRLRPTVMGPARVAAVSPGGVSVRTISYEDMVSLSL